MTTKVAKTPDGVVVRIIRASGECSYRKNIDGSWAMCGDHKGPWISLPEIDIPITARNVVAALAEDNRPGTFNE